MTVTATQNSQHHPSKTLHSVEKVTAISVLLFAIPFCLTFTRPEPPYLLSTQVAES